MLDGIRNFRIDYKVGIAIILVVIIGWIFVVRVAFQDAVDDVTQPIESPR